MKEVVIRNNLTFGEIRLVAINGTYYAVASDVFQALGIRKSSYVSRKCKNVIKHSVPTNGGPQTMNVIPVKEVQRLIFTS